MYVCIYIYYIYMYVCMCVYTYFCITSVTSAITDKCMTVVGSSNAL